MSTGVLDQGSYLMAIECIIATDKRNVYLWFLTVVSQRVGEINVVDH